MPKFFNAVTVSHTDDESKTYYNQYKDRALAMGDKVISIQAFLNVYVHMKCLNCHAESREHFGDYGLDIEEYSLPFPIDWCPDCGLQH